MLKSARGFYFLAKIFSKRKCGCVTNKWAQVYGPGPWGYAGPWWTEHTKQWRLPCMRDTQVLTEQMEPTWHTHGC